MAGAYPNDMAVARQSEVDQSVNNGPGWLLKSPGNVDIAVQTLA
jgi:hypothetical protein